MAPATRCRSAAPGRARRGSISDSARRSGTSRGNAGWGVNPWSISPAGWKRRSGVSSPPHDAALGGVHRHRFGAAGSVAAGHERLACRAPPGRDRHSAPLPHHRGGSPRGPPRRVSHPHRPIRSGDRHLGARSDRRLSEVHAGAQGVDWTILAAPAQIEIHLRETVLDQGRALEIERLDSEIARVMGLHLFARDGATMEEVIGRLLRDAGSTLATAESVTGGAGDRAITRVPDSPRDFRGGLVSDCHYATPPTL